MKYYRFSIALSYAGEHRDFVQEVADELAGRFSKEKVLFDLYHDAEFARPDLDLYLPKLYINDSELVVVFLCPNYEEKMWCRLEWRHIRALIASENQGQLMLLHFGAAGDLTKLGLTKYDGTLDVSPYSPREIAQKVANRLHANRNLGAAISFEPPSSSPLRRGADLSQVTNYAPRVLCGRATEVSILSSAWNMVMLREEKQPHIVSVIALGGEGKTSLVGYWASNLLYGGYASCELAFAWSFYRQGSSHQPATSSDLFVQEALKFFGDAVFATEKKNPIERAVRLATLVGSRRSLLVLDGLEPLQHRQDSTVGGWLLDPALVVLLKILCEKNEGLCIVTSRYSISDLTGFTSTTAPELKLPRLTTENGVDLLRRQGVRGQESEARNLVENLQGHALSISLFGAYLRDAHGGDIRKRDRVHLKDADNAEASGHAFRIVDAYVRWLRPDGLWARIKVALRLGNRARAQTGFRGLTVLMILGLFDRPAEANLFSIFLTGAPIKHLNDSLSGASEAEINLAISLVERSGLVTTFRDVSGNLISMDVHPLIREYFSSQLQRKHPKAWRTAHLRLFEYLHSTTDDVEAPTLAQLQPIYQAVLHGNAAEIQGRVYKEVYRERITKGDAYYSTSVLGAFGADLGAVASFFDDQWLTVTKNLSTLDRAAVLQLASFRLKALCRLIEAIPPLELAARVFCDIPDWVEAAIAYSNLSELYVAIGDLRKAKESAELGVVAADKTQKLEYQMSRRVTLAYALHRNGLGARAEEHYLRALELQEQREPEFPQFSSVWGTWYMDFLLERAESVAWKMYASGTANLRQDENSSEKFSPAGRDDSLATVDLPYKVSPEILNSLKIARNLTENALARAMKMDWSLSIGLDRWQLGRIELLNAILIGGSLRDSDQLLEVALSELRLAGEFPYMPLGMISRAWLRCMQGRRAEAKHDLDEALEIAERGPMPLFQADIYLARARLFLSWTPYPWKSCLGDLTESRRLIERHGYWRRKCELEDAERSFQNRNGHADLRVSVAKSGRPPLTANGNPICL